MKTSPLTLAGSLALLFVVAAILLPFFARQRQYPRFNCLSNEKQIGLALLQYSEDYDERFPPISSVNGSKTWRGIIYPYIKSPSPYQCPNDPIKGVGSDGLPTSYMGNYSGEKGPQNPYAGEGLFSSPGTPGVSTNDIPHPELLIALCDGLGTGPGVTIGSGLSAAGNSKISARHMDGTNFLFADGHAKWLKPQNTANATPSSIDTNDQSWNAANPDGPVSHPLTSDVQVNLWYRDLNRPLSKSGQDQLNEAASLYSPPSLWQSLFGSKPADSE